jgi:hypothetical protein
VDNPTGRGGLFLRRQRQSIWCGIGIRSMVLSSAIE